MECMEFVLNSWKVARHWLKLETILSKTILSFLFLLKSKGLIENVISSDPLANRKKL